MCKLLVCDIFASWRNWATTSGPADSSGGRWLNNFSNVAWAVLPSRMPAILTPRTMPLAGGAPLLAPEGDIIGGELLSSMTPVVNMSPERITDCVDGRAG